MLETELKKNTAALEALTAIMADFTVPQEFNNDAEMSDEDKKLTAPPASTPPTTTKAAPKKEKAPEPQPDDNPEDFPTDATKGDVLDALKQATLLERAVLNDIAEGSGTPAESKKPATLVLKKYNATALGELKEEDFRAVVIDLNELIAGYAE